ncbi:MAG: ABC transporter substrate-binding protein [Thermoleophilia bacterium]|nr:ABC transporter substrate-binding protein [Thermoleophilia bacterium]
MGRSRALLLLLLSLLAAAALSVSACGGGDDGESATTTDVPPATTGASPATTEEPPATTEEPPATTEEPKEPVVLGFVGPLSEPGDVRSGTSMLEVAELWVADVNAQGGIDGHPVELAVEDDQGQPEVGTSALTRVITEKKAAAVVGLWHSSVTLAEMEVARRYNVPILANYSWADEVTQKGYEQVFRIGPYNSLISALMVPFLRDQGYTKVAVLAEDTDYGIGFAKALEEAAAGEPAIDVVQFQAQTADLTPELSKLASDPPDATIVASVYAASNLVFNQAKEVGLDTQIIAGWDWPTLPDFWETVGENGVGVIYPTFFDRTGLELTAEGERFRTLHDDATGGEPAIFNYFLWDCMNAVKWAIEQSGSTDPAELVKTLPGADFEGTTGQITFANEPGTVHFNQWEAIAEFFKQMTEVGQTDEQATLVYTSRQ